MVSINGKEWNTILFSDVVAHLATAENESLFFEYKQDEEKIEVSILKRLLKNRKEFAEQKLPKMGQYV